MMFTRVTSTTHAQRVRYHEKQLREQALADRARLKLERAEAAQEIATLAPLVERDDVSAMRTIAGLIQRKYDFNARVVFDPTGNASFNHATRTATVPPITDAQSFAETLHELFHDVVGQCLNTYPHYRDPGNPHSWCCLRCEIDAWKAAMQEVPFSRSMFERLRKALNSYRDTPAPREVRCDLDAVMGTLDWAIAKQKRVMQQWRLERQAAANALVARDRELMRRRPRDTETNE